MNPRDLVRFSIRLVSLLLAAVAVGIVIWWFCVGVLDDSPVTHPTLVFHLQIEHLWIRRERIGPWIMTLLFFAIALWLLQKPLSRLLVPTLGPTCSKCGYSLRNRDSAGCPECGAGMKDPTVN